MNPVAMNPVAFELFGQPIRWYGIIIAGGVLVAFFVSYILAKKKGLDFDIITDGFLWSFPFAIVGARLYYVAFEYKNYHSFLDVINIRNGGMAIHGGLIGGLVVAYIFTRIKKINFFEYIDVIKPGVILAQAIGRWGNFMNQEAHGGPVTEAFISKFPEFIQRGMLINGTYYHPTFLYESIWDLAIFIFIWSFRKKKKYEGQLAIYYLILYSLGRFFIEGLRTDSLMIGPLRMAQVISLITIIVCLILHKILSKRNKEAN